jgi:protocatechuate 3,4-dioxygenase beta subunit
MAVVFSLFLMPYVTASAQATGSATAGATISGIVYDSTGRSPLLGAFVQVVGADDSVLGRRYTAHTDSGGLYSIPSVRPGRYLAGFQHPRLDSIGLEIEERTITVAEQALRLDFATLSPATFIGIVCPDQRTGSLLVGHVRRTEGQAPLADATVVATWTELDTTSIVVRQRNREHTVRTAPSGWFGLCGLPGDISFLARAAAGADSSGYVRLSLQPRSVQVATFHVGGAVRSAPTDESSPGGASPVTWRGEAQLSGTVRNESGQPMANARLSVWGTSSETTTDARGRFRLGNLPGGTQTVEVRAIGYQPAERVVQLSAEDPATTDIAFSERVTELTGVTVTATAARARLSPFYERMRDAERGINHGYFITPEDMERRRPTLITNMFEGLAGIRVVRRSLDPRWAVVEGTLNGGCPMTVYLDGIRVAGSAGGGHDPLNILIDPTTVAAMEVYPRPVSAPPRYQSLNGTCGVILIWTK